MLFWRATPLSARERAISNEIKALKTLTVEDGRVSIDPSEVLDRPGYLQDRVRAAALVRKH